MLGSSYFFCSESLLEIPGKILLRYVRQCSQDSHTLTGSQSNGGVVTKIEAQADVVIADRIRRDCPAGSISWQWIEQSVKQGRLLDTDDFRAGPAMGVVRDIGSARPTRGGRTAFTAEDDRILMEWVTRAEKKGAFVKGNEIYKQLEQQVSTLRVREDEG